jgi:hypothetical protein
MKAIKKILAWFSQRSIITKIVIVIFALLLSCCICSVPIGLLLPSTPTPIGSISVTPEGNQPSGSTEKDSTPTIIVPSDTPLATIPPKPTNTHIPTATFLPTETPNPNLITPGTYIVGTDIQPGIYKGETGIDFFDSCYWERLKDLTGSFDSIIANNNSIGQFYIEVKQTDYALNTDCELTRLEVIPEHTGEYPQKLKPGTYLVGSDIRPGTYKGQAGTDFSESCYWERLRSVSGEFDAIIANDNAIGQFYIQVLPTDFALNTDCELEWVGP